MTMEFLLSDWLFDSYNLYGPHLDCVTSFKNEAKIGKIGPDFLYICTTTGATAKRMAPWIQRINRSSYLIDVLTVDEGVSQIGRVFEYSATPSGDMLKRMAPVDSAIK